MLSGNSAKYLGRRHPFSRRGLLDDGHLFVGEPVELVHERVDPPIGGRDLALDLADGLMTVHGVIVSSDCELVRDLRTAAAMADATSEAARRREETNLP